MHGAVQSGDKGECSGSRRVKSHTGSIFTCDLTLELIQTVGDTGKKIGFIYSLWAVQAARELQKLSHYLLAKITVVTVCARVCVWQSNTEQKEKKKPRRDTLTSCLQAELKALPCQVNYLTSKIPHVASAQTKKRIQLVPQPEIVFHTQLFDSPAGEGQRHQSDTTSYCFCQTRPAYLMWQTRGGRVQTMATQLPDFTRNVIGWIGNGKLQLWPCLALVASAQPAWL